MTMINQPTISAGPTTPQQDKWLTITDFSAGIQQKVMTPGIIQPSPGGQGAASIQNTYRCISLPSGGLGPLPGRYKTFTFGNRLDGSNIHVPGATQYVTSFFVAPTINPLNTYQAFERDTSIHYVNFFFSNDYTDNNGVSWHVLDVYDPTAEGELTNLVKHQFTNQQSVVAAPYFSATRCQPTSSVNTGENLLLGWPIIVVSYCSADQSFAYAYSFPNAIEPYAGRWAKYDYNAGATNVTPPAGGSPPHTHTYNIPGFLRNTDVFTVAPGANGMTVAHQGRVLFFPEYQEPPPEGGNPPDEQRYHNEAVTYTIPNDYRQDDIQTWSGQGIVDGASGTISGTSYQSVFGQETPTGFGCMHSISSSDLLIIKHGMGAYLVQGDLNVATVRRLPSVISTGGTRCVGIPSPYGFVYGVNHGGVYAWTGADGSELMSTQLEDDFWITPNMNHVNQFKGVFTTWDNWCLVPNNWLFDGNAWWRIEDESIAHWFAWQRNPVTNVLYGARDQIADHFDPPLVDAWDKMQPSSSYSWQSHPMGGSIDRTLNFRTIALTTQGSGKVTITLTDADADPVMEQLELPAQARSGPIVIRKPTDFTAATVTLRIQADSSDPAVPAPIVHQISLGYDEALPVQEAMT